MLAHPNPVTVCIAGGGEGATARETLRHNTVQRIVMIDLDAEVVDLCREYLEGHHQGAFDDPRLDLQINDASVYLKDTPERLRRHPAGPARPHGGRPGVPALH